MVWERKLKTRRKQLQNSCLRETTNISAEMLKLRDGNLFVTVWKAMPLGKCKECRAKISEQAESAENRADGIQNAANLTER
jgi:hypothetical protein